MKADDRKELKAMGKKAFVKMEKKDAKEAAKMKDVKYPKKPKK